MLSALTGACHSALWFNNLKGFFLGGGGVSAGMDARLKLIAPNFLVFTKKKKRERNV